jgi:uncharacterized protein (DUF169 family)
MVTDLGSKLGWVRWHALFIFVRIKKLNNKKGDPMVSLKVFNSVGQELRRIEQAYNVRVLHACESGGRAWGFAPHDSDYESGSSTCTAATGISPSRIGAM